MVRILKNVILFYLCLTLLKIFCSHLAFNKKYDLLNFIKIHISLKISLNVNFYKVFSDKGKIKKNNNKKLYM